MKLGEWLDLGQARSRLNALGMQPEPSVLAADLYAKAAAKLADSLASDHADVIACWVPGRIEVFGKHTDYCGGQSCLAAIERGFCMVAARRPDLDLHLTNVDSGETCEFRISAELNPQTGHWSNYPQTVARRMAANFPGLAAGASVAFSSNLPRSSGMSSSSALMIGVFLILAEINRLQQHDTMQKCILNAEDLAGYLGSIENGSTFKSLAGEAGVGTFGGSEDHTAILCARPSALVCYSFCPVRLEKAIAVDEQFTFAVACSGVVAEKTGGAMEKYNRLSAQAAEIVAAWNRSTGHNRASLAAIMASTPQALDQLRSLLQGQPTCGRFSSVELTQRLEHFVIESALESQLPDVLGPETVGHFSSLANQSHDVAVRLLKNDAPETNYLADLARQLGAYAASSFGAGFGGSVWALVPQSATTFFDEWRTKYQRAYPATSARSEFFHTRPGPAAVVWT